ncbi:ParA family protein [Paraburkholderia terricola]|uniref:Cellulose biosynthesis protein BcsQ n=1 Tax=Paraburkholderia terricola TaxID=169427 RepID=A0A1M6YGJ3_9BURK|nr:MULTISPECIES: ParA family protein [Paraburkholderia]SDP38517.1 Cellulose biosynthesis protein BcsQ [Paraburkholderia sediminicola]SHL17406.1 Cellulose biosynthesis protein BcsQ [Paraburkholderia terricola]
MKSLLIISAKGNSGRTLLTCLLARHLHRINHRRVLVLDLAEPPRCAQMLASRGHNTTGSGNRAPDLPECTNRITGGCVRVLSADAIDGLRSRDDPARTRYYANLRHLLSVVAPRFNVCLIDAPILPDLRAVCAEALADAVLSPLAMSPECVECASAVINGTYGIRNVRARLNPALRFAGLLPVVDVPSPMEEAWVKMMEATLREWLIVDRAFPHGYAWLPRLRSVGRIEPPLVPYGQAAAQDVGVAEASRTVTACLNVLTRRLDVIGNDAVHGLRDAEVCDA